MDVSFLQIFDLFLCYSCLNKQLCGIIIKQCCSNCWDISIQSTTANSYEDGLVLEIEDMTIEGEINNCHDTLIVQNGKLKLIIKLKICSIKAKYLFCNK